MLFEQDAGQVWPVRGIMIFRLALTPAATGSILLAAGSRETAAKSAWHECRRKGGVTCNTAAAICG